MMVAIGTSRKMPITSHKGADCKYGQERGQPVARPPVRVLPGVAAAPCGAAFTHASDRDVRRQ